MQQLVLVQDIQGLGYFARDIIEEGCPLRAVQQGGVGHDSLQGTMFHILLYFVPAPACGVKIGLKYADKLMRMAFAQPLDALQNLPFGFNAVAVLLKDILTLIFLQDKDVGLAAPCRQLPDNAVLVKKCAHAGVSRGYGLLSLADGGIGILIFADSSLLIFTNGSILIFPDGILTLHGLLQSGRKRRER